MREPFNSGHGSVYQIEPEQTPVIAMIHAKRTPKNISEQFEFCTKQTIRSDFPPPRVNYGISFKINKVNWAKYLAYLTRTTLTVAASCTLIAPILKDNVLFFTVLPQAIRLTLTCKLP